MKSFPTLAPAVALAACAVASAQSVERVSVSSSGAEANGPSSLSLARAISADGRYVVFASAATNLVAGDTNAASDVFVRDRANGTTVRVSVTSTGFEAVGASQSGAISSDGRFVVFESTAANLAAGDSNGASDVFVHDRVTARTTIASVDSNGVIGAVASASPSISGDGRLIAFTSLSELVAGASNGFAQVFVFDQSTARTVLVSRALAGGGANGSSAAPEISPNGFLVAFESDASDLVGGDGNGVSDVFVRDLVTGAIERVSVTSAGAQVLQPSRRASISHDGRWVAFESLANDLAPGDPVLEPDVFLRDRVGGTTVRASVDAGGTPGDGASTAPALGADGRFAAFASAASNLAPGLGTGGVDVFLRDNAGGYVVLASVGVPSIPPAAHAGPATAPSTTPDGRFVAFQTGAANLVAGDTNAAVDVFVADTQLVWHPDADGDTFGDATVSVPAVAPPPSHVLDASDCDDTNAGIYPGAPEVCNGLDDDCDTLADEDFTGIVYCTSSTTTSGCRPAISSVGIPSATATSGYTLLVGDSEGATMGSIVYGLGETAFWIGIGSTSVRCVEFPIEFTGGTPTGGTLGGCDGGFSVDWNAYMRTHPIAVGQPVLAGQTFYAQGWIRDQGADPRYNLSNAIRFVVCP
jgi:Tol biopolymer transport system component